jgi:hypothetical protein
MPVERSHCLTCQLQSQVTCLQPRTPEAVGATAWRRTVLSWEAENSDAELGVKHAAVTQDLQSVSRYRKWPRPFFRDAAKR